MRAWITLVLVCALAVPVKAAPPATAAEHVAAGRQALADLTDLQLEAPLARQVALEVLGTIAFGLEDELRLVLDALQVELAPGVLKVPLRWLLGVLDMRGLDTRAAAEALARAEGGAGPAVEAAARLSMVLEGCVRGSRACVGVADELLLGITQLVRFVTKAVSTIEKLSGRVEVLPGAGRAARAIRRAVVKRLVRALDSVVYLATRPLRQPLRSRVRAAAAILTTVLFRWDPTALGLPGPTTGAVLIAKAYLLGGPKIGAFARMQRAVDRAAQLALAQGALGPLERAAGRALGLIDAVMRESQRRSRLAGIERHSAKIAGVASDIAAILTLADPSGIARIVAAVARVMQGTLIVHATYLSASMLHKIPREVSRMVDAAFDPDGPGPVDAPRAKRAPVAPVSAPISPAALETALDGLADALPQGGALDRLAEPVGALERASDALVAGARASADATREPAFGRGAAEAELLRHDLAACALLAGCLDLTAAGKSASVPRKLFELVDEVRASGGALGAPRGKRGIEVDEDLPMLVVHAPAAVSVGSGRAVEIAVENAGTQVARAVEVRIGGRTIALGDVGAGVTVAVPVRELPADAAVESAALVVARDASGTEVAQAIWVRP
jgi:hypothetical protein